MAYEKVNWYDRELKNPNKLLLKNMTTNEIINYEIQEDLSNIEQEGSLVGAKNLGKMDNGIYDLDSTKKTGWNDDLLTYTNVFASWDLDTKTGVININSDVTGLLSAGMKLKFKQNNITKFAYLTLVGEFNNGITPITCFFGTQYILTNETITNLYYSLQENPVAFPKDINKWCLISTSTFGTQENPTNGTWYNLNGHHLDVSAGLWKLEYKVGVYPSKTSAGAIGQKTTLSTNTSGETDSELTAFTYIASTNIAEYITELKSSKNVNLTSKTRYSLLHSSTYSLNALRTWSVPAPTIKATCLYAL